MDSRVARKIKRLVTNRDNKLLDAVEEYVGYKKYKWMSEKAIYRTAKRIYLASLRWGIEG